MVADPEVAQHDVEHVLARRQRRHGRPQRREQRRRDVRPGVEAEDVHPQGPSQHPPMGVDHRRRQVEQIGQGGVGGGEVVGVDGQALVGVVAPRCEIGGLDQRHVAAVAIRLRSGGVVEARHAVPGDAAQQERVVMVLAAQPAVVVQRFGQMNLVAGAAEGRALVQRLQESALVQGRLGLDEKAVDAPQQGVRGERERIALRRRQGVVGVAAHAHRDHPVARHATDAEGRGRVVLGVEIRVVEAPAQQWRDVVAAGAHPRRRHVAIPGQHLAAGIGHREGVGGVVEGGEPVGARLPSGVGIGVAAGAVLVVRQVGQHIAAGACEGGRKSRFRAGRAGRRSPLGDC